MSCAQSRSRNGYRRTRASSSPVASAVPPDGELRLDPPLGGDESEFVEPGGYGGDEGLVDEVGEYRPPP